MRRWIHVGVIAGIGAGQLVTTALAHGGSRIEDERLNIGLVALSFALIGAFLYLAAQGRGGRGSDI